MSAVGKKPGPTLQRYVGEEVEYQEHRYTIVAANDCGLWCYEASPPFICRVTDMLFFHAELVKHMTVVNAKT
jgi:hypothetical protein